MNGNRNENTPVAGSSPSLNTITDTDVVLKWLTHLLVDEDPEGSQPVMRVMPERILHSENAKTWKPGKLTEVMRRLGQLGDDSSSDEDDNEVANFNLVGSKVSAPTAATGSGSRPSASTTRPLPPQNEPSSRPTGSMKPLGTRGKAGFNSFNFNAPRRFSPPRVLPSASASTSTNSKSITASETSSSVKTNGITHTGLFTQVGPTRTYVLDSGVPIRPVDTSRSRVMVAQPRQSIEPLSTTRATGPFEEKPVLPAFQTAAVALAISDQARGIKRTLPAPNSPTKVSGLRKAPRLDNGVESKPEKKPEDVSENPEVNELMLDERMKNVDIKMVEAVMNEVVEVGASTDWDDIAGLQGVKAIIREIIIWPMLRPDIFTGLRGPPKGILLFGPPGTGKTMIGRLIATQSKSIFFNISASSLTSKWIGDGEKMVRALFQVARVKQPAVIFIDEIDSILTQRSDTEHESSRRLKTEFLIQFDGCGTKSEDKILVIGVTNRPQELDEAARRRLVKRIYIPLPDLEGRKQLVRNLVKGQHVSLEDSDFDKIAEISEGYSGADMASLCKEASYGPIRDIGHDIQNIQVDKVRPILLKDFQTALMHVKASVASNDLTNYEDWDKQFGCHT